MEPIAGSHFRILTPHNEVNHFCDKNMVLVLFCLLLLFFLNNFHVVPGVFSSTVLTCCMDPSWFPFLDFEPHLIKYTIKKKKKSVSKLFHVVVSFFFFLVLLC